MAGTCSDVVAHNGADRTGRTTSQPHRRSSLPTMAPTVLTGRHRSHIVAHRRPQWRRPYRPEDIAVTSLLVVANNSADRTDRTTMQSHRRSSLPTMAPAVPAGRHRSHIVAHRCTSLHIVANNGAGRAGRTTLQPHRRSSQLTTQHHHWDQNRLPVGAPAPLCRRTHHVIAGPEFPG